MKRVNNKYRNNNGGNNQIYSLNYKFDSSSIAGKCSGTALDLIKRYNELAKDAASDNDYVTAEVFRQYAEHYRKIVTEINEKKNQNRQMNNQQNQSVEQSQIDNVVVAESNDNNVVEPTVCNETGKTETVEKKSFTVVEIPHTEAETATDNTSAEETVRKPKRVYRRKQAVAE